MPDNLIERIINSSLEKNAIEFKESFEESMNERIAIELRDKKMEIANNIVDEGALKTGARLVKNFGRAAFAPGAIGVDSLRLDKMHDTVKAAMKKQKVEEVEIEEEEDEEMEEGVLRNTGRALKAVAKGVVSPAGAYLNSRKADAIQRDLDKLKSTRAYRTVQQGRKISRQL